VLAGTALHRVFLPGIAQRRHVRLAVEGVGLDVELAVQRDQPARLRHDQRVDLDQAGIAFDIQSVERQQNRLELSGLPARKPEAEGELPALEGLQPGRRMHRQRQDLLRLVLGHLLDVHAAGRRGHDGDAAALAIEREAQVQLALDVRARLHVHALDRQAGASRLLRDEALAEHAGRGCAHRADVPRQLHASGLAAAAGVDLSLHHPERPPQRLGGGDCLIGRGGHPTRGHRNSIIREDFFRLIFVQIHPLRILRSAKDGGFWRKDRLSASTGQQFRWWLRSAVLDSAG
jgi:hypothetical protein